MTDENRFPLSTFDRHQVGKVVHLVRSRLATMTPGQLRSAASALHALERLPIVTPGIQVSFGFTEPNGDGNYAWTDIKVSESEFLLLVGEHFYDPAVGGDTETRVVFEAHAGDASRKGDMEDWLETAGMIAPDGLITAEDYSDHDSVDWFSGDEDASDDSTDQRTSPQFEAVLADHVTSNDELRRIFEEASGPMKEPIRDQMAYRHMIALADNFEGWALDARITPEQSAKLVGWAESLRRLADDVGPGWEPPTPDRLTLMGFLGRKVLGE